MSRTSAGIGNARSRPHGPQIRTLFNGMNLPDELRTDFDFLLKIKDREGFFDLIKTTHPVESPGYGLIRRAYNDAEESHSKRRRHSGEREFRHLFRCALILRIYCEVVDPDDIAAMLEHDLPETFRRKWTYERIALRSNDAVAKKVFYLTKPRQRRGETKREVERRYYRGQLAHAPRMEIMKKGVDALDNLITLWKRSAKRIYQKINDVLQYLLPLLRKHRLFKLLKAIQAVLKCIRHKLQNNIAFAY